MAKASEIASFLRESLQGPDLEVRRPCPLSRLEKGALVFVTRMTPSITAALNETEGACALIERDVVSQLRGTFIPVDVPRLAFAHAVRHFFSPIAPVGIEPTAVIGNGCILGANVYVGHYTILAAGVEIGEGSVIEHHVTIGPQVRIGKGCHVRSNTVIGGPGYGFEREASGAPVRLPHLGGVRIGDHVEIGSLNSIARGTLDDTVIDDHAKLDDHVFIAHNVRVGRGAMVIACAEVSGSVEIGEGAWIAPQASIRQKLKIGAGATVGLGAVVLRDVANGEVVVGNPAKTFEKTSR